MNILDENILNNQRQLLASWGIRTHQIGDDIGRKGMQDDEIISTLHHQVNIMATKNVAVTIDRELLGELDHLVAQHIFPNRSKAFQEALQDKLIRMRRDRLARECAKLDPRVERALAEEGLELELPAWHAY